MVYLLLLMLLIQVMVLEAETTLSPVWPSHPSDWLLANHSKLQVKKMARAAVLEFWLAKLRSQADVLPSLKYLQTGFMGLSTCHPLFRLCGSSQWEVEKAVSQARLLSGRYRVEAISCHWIAWK